MAKFGENVAGYNIPVLNEREIRASAGILFALMYTALMLIVFKGNASLIKYLITAFLLDFIVRIFIGPKYAPTLIIGRWIVRRQVPEYVGAPQKRFAWIIGLVLASIMFVLMPILSSFSIISGLICLICLIFLFFESVFGICLGCLVFHWIKKEKAQYCPGEVCDVKSRHEIQKINLKQVLFLGLYIGAIALVGVFFNEHFSKELVELWELLAQK